MTSLNKLVLNNTIVAMRKLVKQSRIHCINKLTKEIRQLKSRKGTEEQKIKNLKKIDRIVDEIGVLKKTAVDAVSKYALLNEKSFVEVSNNVNETLDLKAIARLADCKPIATAVSQFREKFPNWKEEIPLLFMTLGQRHAGKKKKPVKNSMNSKRKQVTNYSNVSSNNTITQGSKWQIKGFKTAEKNVPENNKKTISDESVLTSNCNETIEHEITNFGDLGVTSLKNEVKNARVTDPVDRNVNSGEQSTRKSNRIKKDDRTQTEKFNDKVNGPVKEVTSLENDGNMKNARVTGNVTVSKQSTGKSNKIKNDDGTQSEKPRLNNKVKDPVEEVKLPSGSVDPFFVTKDNKEYVSIFKVEEHAKENIPKSYKINFKKQDMNKKHNNLKQKRKPMKHAKPQVEEEKLHPSWEAKRKLQSISSFQGKKVKFE